MPDVPGGGTATCTSGFSLAALAAPRGWGVAVPVSGGDASGDAGVCGLPSAGVCASGGLFCFSPAIPRPNAGSVVGLLRADRPAMPRPTGWEVGVPVPEDGGVGVPDGVPGMQDVEQSKDNILRRM